MTAAVKGGIGGRFGIAHRRSPLILENALQPRMNTDSHGCQAVAANLRLTGRVIESHGPESVFIRGFRVLRPIPSMTLALPRFACITASERTVVGGP